VKHPAHPEITQWLIALQPDKSLRINMGDYLWLDSPRIGYRISLAALYLPGGSVWWSETLGLWAWRYLRGREIEGLCDTWKLAVHRLCPGLMEEP
jgi:hypothetical protein